MEKAYEEQRAKIQSVFKKVSLSLFHVNAFFFFFFFLRISQLDYIQLIWRNITRSSVKSLK